MLHEHLDNASIVVRLRFCSLHCFLASAAGQADEAPGLSGQRSSSLSSLFQHILFISNLYNFWNILNLDPFHAENDSWYEAYFGAVC